MSYIQSAILLFLGSFLLTYFTIPRIIGVVEYKKLLDEPNNRSSHKKITPTLGGVAFYFTLILTFFFLNPYDELDIIIQVLPGLTILFIFGLKDDLVVLSPLAKLIAQVVAVAFVLSNSEILITNLNGFLGIYEIPIYLSYIITGFIMITIINAYNLIDGIDGLAASIGIVISLIYGLIFIYLDYDFFVLLCLSVIAMLIAFLRYNLSKSQKIFMGDTGSLIIGFIISVFTINFLSFRTPELENLPVVVENLPFIAFSILIIPLFDTFRVFAIRMFNKKSPFSPDRNHMHHILIDLGLSHFKTSLILSVANILFVTIFTIVASSSKQIILIFLLALILIGLFYLFFMLDFKFSNLKKKVRFKQKTKELKDKIIVMKNNIFFW